MRRRRDPFARVTYVPDRVCVSPGLTCSWCGHPEPSRLYDIRVEDDQRYHPTTMRGVFCSWSCAESYHDQRIGR